MSYVLVENLTKTLFDRILFDKVSFAVEPGEKVAFVAPNGSGKSTLLKIINDKETYDEGKITKQKGISWGFLEQEVRLDPDKTIETEIFESNSPIIKAIKLYEESLHNPDQQTNLEIAHDMMNRYNAWEFETKLKEILEKLKIDTLLKAKISTLSGGQKKRLALAKVLIDNPDFLIMDEPTNHLDLEMIDWLEGYFKSKKITLLLVTHDRYFLDRVCDRIFEIDKGKIYKHMGNYSYYLVQKGLRHLKENSDIDKAKAFLKKEKVWVDRQPQGRQGKSTARVDFYYKVKSDIQTRHKNITEKVQLDIAGKRVGGKILELHNLNKAYEEKIILKDFNYSFNKGEKVGIIGKNGVGKSTFLNIIMGREPQDSGKIVRGDTIHFGYYSQHQLELNNNEKVIDSIKKTANYVKLSNGQEISATKMLERFLFTPTMQQNLIGNLSGGEKKRVALLQILMTNPNFLILDEPTNDFDLMTLEVLEEFLKEFKGCLIVISHDRSFLDEIVDHLFIFKGEGIINDFPGNYTDYRNAFEADNTDTKINVSSLQPSKNRSNTKTINELYKQISRLEEKKLKLTEETKAFPTDYIKLGEYGKRIKEIELQIEELSEKWLELQS